MYTSRVVYPYPLVYMIDVGLRRPFFLVLIPSRVWVVEDGWFLRRRRRRRGVESRVQHASLHVRLSSEGKGKSGEWGVGRREKVVRAKRGWLK